MADYHQSCFILENDTENRKELFRIMERLGFHAQHCTGAFVCETCHMEPDLVVVGQEYDVPDSRQVFGNVELLIRESQAPVLTLAHHKEGFLSHFDNVQVYPGNDMLEEMAWSLFSSHLKRRTLRNELVKTVRGIQHIDEGEFHFKTLEEAQALALLLAALAPHKKLLRLGLSELFINAVEHGNLGITAEEKLKLKKDGGWLNEIDRRLALKDHRDKFVRLIVKRDAEMFFLDIEDQGDGFNWQETLEQATAQVGFAKAGRGIAIAKKAGLDELNFMGKGNQLQCAFRLAGEGTLL
ncbi:MAG: ATP-binding protein [Methylocystaceae bacterium]|nr:ATP-binding protein [Methylocystaceae bacterium]